MKKKILIILIILFIIILGFFFFYQRKNLILNNHLDYPEKQNEKFDFKLFNTINKYEKNNYLISPYSIKIALSLLKEGASKNTYSEIINTLKEEPPLIKNDNIKIANALFIKNKYEKYIEQNFTNTLRNKYNSELLIDEFKNPQIINNWVSKNTNKMINKILDNIDENFVLGLANALAIDVKWDKEFECINTTKETFYSLNNNKTDTQMMHNTYSNENVKYLKNDKVTIISLPYQEKTNLEFIGILPNNLNEYLNNELSSDYDSLDKTLKPANSKLHINLSIPRFNFSYSLDNFKDILIELGIKDAFNPQTSNLTKIMSRENINKLQLNNLYVDDAIHKTYIDFNESGTKAAAITYFGIKNTTALKPKDYETIDIVFNKPFITIIREKTTNQILFIGLINNPNKWEGTTCNV